MQEYLAEMPWVAIPFESEELRSALARWVRCGLRRRGGWVSGVMEAPALVTHLHNSIFSP